MTTATHLRTIATTWTDLQQALGAPAQLGAFGLGLRNYLNALEQYDLEEATALRMLERDPMQIGARPIPIRLRVYDTMRTVEAALVEFADQTAAVVQRPSMSRAPRGWPAADRARRDQLARADALDPRRWRYTGKRTAPYAALWLLGRVQHAPGPFRPLDEAQYRRIANVARTACERVERVLDIGTEQETLAERCKCGGRIDIHGGAGASPIGHCTGCGTIWTEETGAIAAA